MGDLNVTVRYHGSVVDDRVVPVRGAVAIGDSPGAKVSFPGARVDVVRVGRDLELRGRRLAEGQRTGFSLGPVHVQLEHIEPLRVERWARPSFDSRFLLVALAVTTAGMWLETLDDVARTQEGVVAQQLRSVGHELSLLRSTDRRAERTSLVTPNPALDLLPPADQRAVDGPAAVADDVKTGWAFYEWHADSVRLSSDQVMARVRLQAEPDNVELRSQLAHAAYASDDFEEAAWHYAWLAERHPDGVEWHTGLALAQKRLGRHTSELEHWERVLELEPRHVLALGNRAVAFARLDRWDQSRSALDRLQEVAPEHPYGHVYMALQAALEGADDDALGHLELAMERREALSDDLRIELRRDIALDPALSGLRADPRLMAMLNRQLGARAPRPLAQQARHGERR